MDENKEQEPITYTVSEFASVVGASTQSVHRWIRLGQVKTIDLIGGWRRIPESEVKRFKGEE
jgi:excisionase family DNA binding protein